MRHFAIAAAFLLIAPAVGQAQRLTPPFAVLADPFAQPAPRTVAAFGHPDDHRWEGAYVGGLTVGLMSAFVAAQNCFNFKVDRAGVTIGDCTPDPVEAFVFGALGGAVVGWLVGTLIPKEKAANPE